MTDQALMHHVHPNLNIQVAGQRYSLRSIIVHLGPSPRSGHYVAITRHVTPTGTWWLYNDEHRREAKPDELVCTAQINGQAMKAYVLFYELDTDQSPTQHTQP